MNRFKIGEMKFLLRKRFTDNEDLRAYFSGLVEGGDVLPVTKGVFLVNDLELIRGIMSDAQAFKNYDFRGFLLEIGTNEKLQLSFPELAEASGMWLIFMDGVAHLEAKKQMHKALYEQDLEGVVRTETAVVLDGLEGRESFDLMVDFCDPVVSRIICSLAGVDPVLYPVIKDLMFRMQIAFEPYHTVDDLKQIELSERGVYAAMDSQLLKGSQSLSGMMAFLHRQYGDAGMPKALALLEFFFTAGIETSTLLLCQSLYRLMTDLRGHLPALHAPDERDFVVEELIRMSSGASMLGRNVQSRTILDEREFDRGDVLFMNIAGANRHPRYFPFPDTIHPENMRTKHLAFGSGRHHCVGAILSRLEMRIILPAFFERFKAGSIRPVPGGQVMRELYFTPGFLKLPVTVERQGL